MVDDRLRHGNGPPPVTPSPPRQVGVLVVREEPRIEQADLDEHLPAQQHPPTAETVVRSADHVVVVGLGEVPVVALAVVGQGGAETVDQRGPRCRNVERRLAG